MTYDAIGSLEAGTAMFDEMREAGVEWGRRLALEDCRGGRRLVYAEVLRAVNRALHLTQAQLVHPLVERIVYAFRWLL